MGLGLARTGLLAPSLTSTPPTLGDPETGTVIIVPISRNGPDITLTEYPVLVRGFIPDVRPKPDTKFYIQQDALGKPQKKFFFFGPATKRGGGKGLGNKKSELFLELKKI